MAEADAKSKLRILAEEAVFRVHESGQGFESFRGIAFYDTAKDETFESLESFAAAASALADIPLVQERYGAEEAKRLTLQFVYELLNRLSEPVFKEDAFGETWQAFSDELHEPMWTFRGLANIRNFRSDLQFVQLNDEVSIRGRSSRELAGLGFTKWHLNELFEDVILGGPSSYVMLVEDRVMKTPENLVLIDQRRLLSRALRVLKSMRLLAPGDVAIGRMWVIRSALFNVGLGGGITLGFSMPAFGSEYFLDSSIEKAIPLLYEDLRHLEAHGYGSAPGNLDLALRSFMATYDRGPLSPDSRVLDAITAVEAVLGSGTEIAFKLSFRVAGILGKDDANRVAIFNDMKAYYDLRSKLVHGDKLKESHRRLLMNHERLRGLVRHLLRAFVRLATTTGHFYDKRFFQEQLDSTLQDSAARSDFRKAMGLI